MTNLQAPGAVVEPPASEFQALLEVSESIALHRDLTALFHDLAGRLHRVVEFDFLSVVLHDDARNVMRLHILETEMETDLQPGRETPVDQSLGGEVWRTQRPLVIADV